MHSWTNLILAVVAFGLAVAAASLGTKHDGLLADPGRPEPSAAPGDLGVRSAQADRAPRGA